jgi:homoserine acetyltransferase
MATKDLPLNPKPQEPQESNNNDSFKTYPLGDFTLQNNTVLPNAHLAYKTLGSPSLPAIIYPTWYSGTIASNLWLTGPSKTLDPQNYYIIIPALFGNGESTSPSNWTHKNSKPFPQISFYDNVRAQHELVTKGLGLTGVRAVLGWSMGAGQTFQWATQFPGFMELAVPFCGSARTSLHNRVFLEGVKVALLGPRGVESGGVCEKEEGEYRAWSGEEKRKGLKAL